MHVNDFTYLLIYFFLVKVMLWLHRSVPESMQTVRSTHIDQQGLHVVS